MGLAEAKEFLDSEGMILRLSDGQVVRPLDVGINFGKLRNDGKSGGDEWIKDLLNYTLKPEEVSYFCDADENTDISDSIEDCQNKLKRWDKNPFAFPKEYLHINTDIWPDDLPPENWKPKDRIYPLWSKQREIQEALFKYKRVAVKSGMGVGKTFLAAIAALTLFYVKEAMVITTSRIFKQLKRQLWGEIHRIYGRAEKRNAELGYSMGGQLNQISLDMGGKWFMEGISAATHNAGTFHGYHGEENIALFMDEAGLIERPIFDAIEGILSAEDSYALFIGQPIDPLSGFADIFKSSKNLPDGESFYNENTGFYCISISCLDAPNIKHKRKIYPGMSSFDWVERKKKTWGETSMLYQSRVAAKFPEDTEDCLFPLHLIEAGLGRYKEWEQYLPDLELKVISCDVARKGRDRTVIGLLYEGYIPSIMEKQMKDISKRKSDSERERDFIDDRLDEEDDEDTIEEEGQRVIQMFKIVRVYEKKKLTYTAGTLKILYDDKKGENTAIHVDDNGVGGGVTDELEEDDYPVVDVVVTRNPAGDSENEQFENQRMEFYWRVAKALESGTLAIEDEELGAELTKIKYEPSRKGKIKIIEKSKIQLEKLAEAGKRDSPDKADCLMIAYGDSSSVGIRFLS